jgi:uncharacterized protein (TIGR00730 family)
MAEKTNAEVAVPLSTKDTNSRLNICVFCSANDLDDKYTKPAQEFARLIAEHGYNLVWGGSDKGLMNVMASGVQQGGAKIIGVSVEYLRNKAREDADEMIIAKDLGERKATMLSRSDVIVTMVGGIGTIDEITDILEHKKHGHHNKPVIILNTKGFYNGLKQQLQRMEVEGFLVGSLEDYIHFADTPEEVIAYIDNFREQNK